MKRGTKRKRTAAEIRAIKALIADPGVSGETRARKWLEYRGFTIIERHKGPRRGYYDIKASRDGETWLIEVKSGVKPNVTIENLVKMLETPKIKVAALIFVSKRRGPVLLQFTLRKMEYAAFKAWHEMRKAKPGKSR